MGIWAYGHRGPLVCGHTGICIWRNGRMAHRHMGTLASGHAGSFARGHMAIRPDGDLESLILDAQQRFLYIGCPMQTRIMGSFIWESAVEIPLYKKPHRGFFR